jgi:hypothetical protein
MKHPFDSIQTWVDVQFHTLCSDHNAMNDSPIQWTIFVDAVYVPHARHAAPSTEFL